MRHLAGRLRRALRRLAWPGQAGLALLAGAAFLHFPAAADLAGREEALRRQVRDAAAAARPPDAAAGAGAGPAVPAAEDFPGAGSVDAFLLASHEAALRHDLVLARGDIRATPESGGHLVRHRLQLPVEGRYGDLRAWLAGLMNAYPSLALEDVQLNRREVSLGRVEAQLRLSLLTRRP